MDIKSFCAAIVRNYMACRDADAAISEDVEDMAVEIASNFVSDRQRIELAAEVIEEALHLFACDRPDLDADERGSRSLNIVTAYLAEGAPTPDQLDNFLALEILRHHSLSRLASKIYQTCTVGDQSWVTRSDIMQGLEDFCLTRPDMTIADDA